MRPHLGERAQSFVGDRLDDLALAHAVAAADFRIIRQGCNGRRRVQGSASDVGLTEDQGVAQFRDIRLLAQEIEEPGSVAGLAVEDGADDAVLLEHEALVDAPRGIAQDDVLPILGLAEIAGREQVDARDLQLGRGDRAGIGGRLVAGELGCHHLRHLVERRHEAVAEAAMLDAFADREHIRVAGAHVVADEHAPVGLEARLLGENRIRTDADGHDDDVGGKLACRRRAGRR